MTSKGEKPDLSLSDQAIDWIVKLKSGAATEADIVSFAAWRGQSAAHEAAAKEAELIWHGVGIAGDEAIAKENKEKRAKLTRRAILGGTSLALAGWGAVKSGLIGPRLFADYATAVGEQRSITLADNSSVLLNAASALSVSFNDRERKVRLIEGQATFTVSHDAARPFIVLAGSGSTRAMGTQFDIDMEEDDVAVTVIEGKVSVNGADSLAPGMTVEADERVRYAAGAMPSRPETVDAERETAWRRGKLIFEQRPLGDVINTIARYTRGPIIVLDRNLRALPVTGVFNLADPSSVLDTIEQTLPVRIARLSYVTILR